MTLPTLDTLRAREAHALGLRDRASALRGACVALASAIENARPPEEIARRLTEYEAAESAILTAEEREAVAWCARVWWLPGTKARVAALLGALGRLAG
jgi:hypothetical protein